jgi:HEAT repeat protein
VRCLDLLPTFSRVGSTAFVDYDHLSPSGASLASDTILASGLLPEGYSNAEALRTRLGEDGGSAAGLARALADASPELRAAAAWALGRSAGSAAVPALERGLADDASAAVRAAAARALGTMGESSRRAMPALFAALADPSESVRYEAAQALMKVGPAAADVRSLTVAVGNADPYVRGFAAWALGNIGAPAAEAVPALVTALAEDDTATVVAAALARMGPGAAQAVPALVASLQSPDAGRRWRAARALGRIGPPAAEAVSDLEKALKDPNEAVRLHAARALGRIGAAARPAASALQRATGDPDVYVRQEARAALERLH